MSDLDNKEVKKHYRNVDINSKILDSLIQECVDYYCKELDNQMSYISRILVEDSKDILDDDLENIVLTIPTLLYWASQGQEVIGVREDISKMMRDSKFVEYFQTLESGSITQKNAVSNEEVLIENAVQYIYDHAYKIISNKVKYALEMLQSAKKILTKRMTDKEISRSDTGNYSSRPTKSANSF